MQVFSTYETGIMATSNEFTMQCCTGTGTGTGRFFKKVCLAFSFLFLRLLCIRPMLNSNFPTKLYFLLNILRSPGIG